jgi:cellulose synthase/poly-beta-1,6-N-acetylglucosamine synthase-like glycosyltransferase
MFLFEYIHYIYQYVYTYIYLYYYVYIYIYIITIYILLYLYVTVFIYIPHMENGHPCTVLHGVRSNSSNLLPLVTSPPGAKVYNEPAWGTGPGSETMDMSVET